MVDAELDIADEVQEPETESEDKPVTHRPFWLMPFIGLFFLLFAVFLITNNSRTGDPLNAGPSEALLSYQSLTSEMHTGLRLARLDDFLAQHGQSPYAGAAISRRSALKRHEEKAWATLTDAFYHTDADEEMKAAAIKAYTDAWTPLHRPDQLKTLSQTLPDDAVPNFKPITKKSRFASGGNDQFLEGGPIVRRPVIPLTVTRDRDRPERIAPSRVVEPRVRGKKRKPSYPSKARRRGIEAEVILELDIDDEGRVRRTRVISVRADRYAKDFAKASERAARKTRFYPKTVGGKPVPMRGYVQKYAFQNRR